MDAMGGRFRSVLVAISLIAVVALIVIAIVRLWQT
jgi:hypothetical protein